MSREVAKAASRVVLAIGNRDRGDDAAGPWIAEALRALGLAGVDIVTSDGEPARLVELLRGRTLAILVDAAQTGAHEGALRVFPPEAIQKGPPRPTSSHALGAVQALELARRLGVGPDQVWLVTVEARRFVPGTAPAPAVLRAGREAGRRILELLGESDRSAELDSHFPIHDEAFPMHEMSLIADLLSKILDVARREGSDRVTAVGVELGALSHCSPQHFTEHFNEAARGTIAEGALLEIMTRDDPSHPRAQEIVLTSVEVEEP